MSEDIKTKEKTKTKNESDIVLLEDLAPKREIKGGSSKPVFGSASSEVGKSGIKHNYKFFSGD